MPSLTVEPQFRFIIGHPLTIVFECRDIGYGAESGVLEGLFTGIPNFLDLFRNVQEHMRRTGPDHFYSLKTEFPDGTTGEVYAVKNNSGRYTIMSPDEY